MSVGDKVAHQLAVVSFRKSSIGFVTSGGEGVSPERPLSILRFFMMDVVLKECLLLDPTPAAVLRAINACKCARLWINLDDIGTLVRGILVHVFTGRSSEVSLLSFVTLTTDEGKVFGKIWRGC